ncbi:VOC family protein [Deinococcus frigens]|uniref:VOC family protein n=1 Tax=Deinococcus frigens TaxID=249403 RepID=UPI0004968BD4|nr:VOC family protein [Deinococcus frigens]
MTVPSPVQISPVQGLHHVTVMASDPQRNIDFYTQVLGQRMVKVTVNFDDPGTYHLYYGDRTGQPGTIMTHFPWPGAARGVRGNGEVVATAYSAPIASYDFWLGRLTGPGLTGAGLQVSRGQRFGQEVLSVADPDGTWVELVFEDGAPVQDWPASPVPLEHALRGFHSVTGWVGDTGAVRDLLVGQLGFSEVGTEEGAGGPRTRFRGGGDDGSGAGVGLFVDVVERPGQPRGSFGAGSVHHAALRTRDDAQQTAYLEQLTAASYRPTPVQDRQYFHSIYFREGNGILFEIATDAPGFPDDEPVDGLGKHLRLPAWYEARRPAIEAHLPRIVSPEYGVTLGTRELGATPRDELPGPGIQVLTAGRPLGEARVAAILLHGRGATAQDILSLEGGLNLSAFTYLAPQAAGNSWYPHSFLAPVAENQPHLDAALATVEDLLTELEAQGIPAQKVVLGGFSQGACLALEYASRSAVKLGGVVALSGALITLDRDADLDGLPIFMGVAPDDAHIPLDRFEASADLLRSRGAALDARVFPGLGHAVNAEELDAMRALMQGVAAQV